MDNAKDAIYMAKAIDLAKLGRFTAKPNPIVGCVIVYKDNIVGEGYHRCAGEPHAEINALEMARNVKGATAYVTLEPCSHYGRTPPCVDAIIASGISRVVIAVEDPNPQVAGKGIRKLIQAGVDVRIGIMKKEAENLNLGFLKRMRTGLPYVRLKLAISLDGRTAMASGESKWITGELARQDAQVYRAQSCAILTTSATVLADDPLLTVRWNLLSKFLESNYLQGSLNQPIKVILDRQQQVLSKHRIINSPGEVWLMHTMKSIHNWPKNVHQFIVSEKRHKINLLEMLQLLGRHSINEVLVEVGPTLAGALLQEGLVDEMMVYLSPKLLGVNSLPMCQLLGITKLSDAQQWIFNQVVSVGGDLRLSLTHAFTKKLS